MHIHLFFHVVMILKNQRKKVDKKEDSARQEENPDKDGVTPEAADATGQTKVTSTDDQESKSGEEKQTGEVSDGEVFNGGDNTADTADEVNQCIYWDNSLNEPCKNNLLNCDCANGCGSTSCDNVVVNPSNDQNDNGGNDGGNGVSNYPNNETVFHHTQSGSVHDGGTSLVMCPGQDLRFDSCNVNGVNIPYHGLDDGRITYWNMNATPVGEFIECEKGGVKYKYPLSNKPDPQHQIN